MHTSVMEDKVFDMLRKLLLLFIALGVYWFLDQIEDSSIILLRSDLIR